LSIEGDFKLGGHVFKAGSEGTGEYPFLHSEGLANTSAGLYGLMNVAPEPANGYGVENTAVGQAALYYTTTGSRNTGLGVATLYPNVDGSDNTAVGFWAMGSEYYPGGDRNIAVGSYAGFNTDGSDNILIGSSGVLGESNVLRIGEDTGVGLFELDKAFIHGIRGATMTGSEEQPICVDSNNQIGPCGISSIRFKQGVGGMGRASRALFDLRPVLFSFKPELKAGESRRQFGLIAEEAAEVLPEIVTHDADGRPFSVRYDLLSPLLLNEIQRQQRQIRTLQVALGILVIVGAGWIATRSWFA
jgi:hypothetical protein